MQKRSTRFEIRYHDIALPPEFPVLVDPLFLQPDSAIRFLHVHPCLELGFCWEGSGIFIVGEKVLPFAAGDVTLISHAEVHLARSSPGTTSRWSWVYLDPLRLGDHCGEDRQFLDCSRLSGPDFQNVMRPTEDGVPAQLIRRMVDELRDRPTGYRVAVRGMVQELMVRWHRRRGFRFEQKAPYAGYERIAPALQRISRDYARPVRVGELARACGMSEPTLRRVFQAAVGRSPREYWHGVRLRMAASLLRTTSRSVLEISQDVGFETLSSFNRLFRSHLGLPPRQWRTAKEPAPASR